MAKVKTPPDSFYRKRAEFEDALKAYLQAVLMLSSACRSLVSIPDAIPETARQILVQRLDDLEAVSMDPQS